MASHRMVSPNTRIDWYPYAGISAPSAPSAAQLNAGTRISGAVESGYTFKFNDSDTDKSKTVEDEGNVETPTLKNYEGKIMLFKDEIGTGTQDAPQNATVFTTAVNLFKTAYVDGWIVVRHGRKASVAYAATHVVSVYRFKNDYPRIVEGDAGNPIRVEVEFLPQGQAWANVAAVA